MQKLRSKILAIKLQFDGKKNRDLTKKKVCLIRLNSIVTPTHYICNILQIN
jgi:hypothetical protein